jgi:hypothetical protein
VGSVVPAITAYGLDRTCSQLIAPLVLHTSGTDVKCTTVR